MANVTFYARANMYTAQTFVGNIIEASPNQIVVSNGFDHSVYNGSFSYFNNNVFGVLQGYREYAGSYLEVQITGLNVDAHLAEAYIGNNQLQSLFSVGLNGDDVLISGAYDDFLIGYAGNDYFRSGTGVDAIDGGPGLDILQVNASVLSSTTSLTDGVRRINSSEGIDLLTNVERVHFYDGVAAFDLYGNAGDAYRIYQAAFDRTPDRPGLSYWVNQMDEGMALSQVALNFILSPEFTATYGNINAMSDAQYVDVMYENVLNRDPDPSGFSYWMEGLANGYPRHFMLAAFSQSTENQANVAAAIQNGILLDLGAFV